MSIFSQVPVFRPKRNVFNMSHERKLSLDMGKLVPIFVSDLVPGDVFRNTSEIFLRFAPMLAPVMHRVNVYTHFFFVPNRLVMPDWTDFITGNDPNAVLPIIDLPGLADAKGNAYDVFGNGSLADYLGLPTINLPKDHFPPGQTSDIVAGDWSLPVQMLPFLAYQLIYNEYYRDQNLQDSIDIDYKKWESLSSVDHDLNWSKVCELRNRNWEKDYFTSCLPWAQKGDPVQIPGTGSNGLSGMAPVEYHPPADGPFGIGDGHTRVIQRGGLTGGLDTAHPLQAGGAGEYYTQDSARLSLNIPTLGSPVSDIDPNGNLFANLDKLQDNSGGLATGNTINDLRTAFQVQKWLERNARAGTRYIEQILAHFGIRTPDSRLQRPEYIGGGRSPVVISEVLQNSSTDQEPTPQGNMAGHGFSAAANNSFKYKALEHGYIIGLMSVMPRSAYQQGIPRHFRRNDKFDFYWPSFANLGEQAVENGEILHFPETADPRFSKNKDTFGYQSRYAEYKYVPSSVHGDMRDSLLFWHMGRAFTQIATMNGSGTGGDVDDFDSKQDAQLNSDFIECHPTKRIFAVTDDQTHALWCQIYNDCKAVRPMPRFSVPGFSDH